MKSKINLFGLYETWSEISEGPEERLEELFIKQVKDDSLPAYQVLVDRIDSRQNEDYKSNDSAPLFVP